MTHTHAYTLNSYKYTHCENHRNVQTAKFNYILFSFFVFRFFFDHILNFLLIFNFQFSILFNIFMLIFFKLFFFSKNEKFLYISIYISVAKIYTLKITVSFFSNRILLFNRIYCEYVRIKDSKFND